MTRFVARRLFQGVLTIMGVMVVTFLLFRVMAGDIASAHVGAKATEQAKAAWRHRHGYDRPLLLNLHRRLKITDLTGGDGQLLITDVASGRSADALALLPSDKPEEGKTARLGRYVFAMNRETPLTEPAGGRELTGNLKIQTCDGRTFLVDISAAGSVGELLDTVNNHPRNRRELVTVTISEGPFWELFDSQFFGHLKSAALLQSRSLKDNQKITEIIRKRAPKSLALTVPAMAVGWLAAMVVSCFVAYYHDTWLDKVGVLLSVVGMCIPFLAFMIFGQWLMFSIAPRYAYGLGDRVNIYVPVVIMIVAGLGGSVRFYRTIILDQVNRDYVRTAKAKGVPLPGILFKHVLKNCMLPILTNLILAIPFLIMGSLLAESYFGIPGLGDLMLSSINGRDEPIMSGLVFLTALVYTIGLLVTDLSYAVFDPRIRLR